ncbi:MAG: cell division protein FtsQ/DivIB [Thermodesulfobacteriota bacterium]
MNKPVRKKPPVLAAALKKPFGAKASRLLVPGVGRAARILGAVALLAGISAAFVAGYGFVTGCDYFAVRSVRVEGAGLLSAEDVTRAAGVRTGENIFAIHLGVARQRLLAEPWIAEAELYRELPGAVIIRVREHAPVAVLDLGDRFFVDGTGSIFKRVEPSDAASLPMIHGLDYGDIPVAGRPGSRAFDAAMEVLDTGSRIERFIFGMRIREIRVDRDTGVILHAFDTIDEVRLGYGDYVDKFRRLNRIVAHFRKNGEQPPISMVGLQWPDRIVVKPAFGAAYAGFSKKGEACGSRT